MGFYIRDSIRVGPFRFNLSKSGVGVSVGVRGARVGMSPRGNYVHMGRHGLYYRTALPSFTGGGGRVTRPRQPQRFLPEEEKSPRPVVRDGGMQEIESADASAMRDSSSEELLREIAEKRARQPLATRLGAFGAVSAAFAGLLLPAFAPVSVAVGVATGVLVATLAGVLVAQRRDEVARTVVLFYQLEGEAEQQYEALHEAFADLAASSTVWHVAAAGAGDWKRSGGAQTTVRRSRVALGTALPSFIQSNIAVPAIPCGRETLYFLP